MNELYFNLIKFKLFIIYENLHTIVNYKIEKL